MICTYKSALLEDDKEKFDGDHYENVDVDDVTTGHRKYQL